MSEAVCLILIAVVVVLVLEVRKLRRRVKEVEYSAWEESMGEDL